MSRQFFSGLKQTRSTADTSLSQDPEARMWTVAQKARILHEAAPLRALALTVYLKRQGVSRQEYERWQQALREDSRPSPAVQYRMDRLKRTLKRQERLLEKAGVAPAKDLATSRRRRGRPPKSPTPSHERTRADLANTPESARKSRGRARKFNPAIPAHIDQTQLPKGIYWNRTGRGRWFMFVTDPDTGVRNTKVVAGPKARLLQDFL